MPENLQQPEADGKQRKQAAAAVAAALAAGETVRRAAELGKVCERTVYNWLRNKPRFRAKVNELRAAAIGSAVNRLSDSMTAASDVLVKLLKSRSEGVRLKAARGVLELATKLRESEELEQRVTELERRAAEGKS